MIGHVWLTVEAQIPVWCMSLEWVVSDLSFHLLVFFDPVATSR